MPNDYNNNRNQNHHYGDRNNHVERNHHNDRNHHGERNYNGDRNHRDRGESRNESIYSKKIKAGKRRTYFFDVRSTRSSDYFITITESKKRFDDNGYERHKMFLYKEDFNKFLNALTDTINHVKVELMPDFDFDAFNHDNEPEEGEPSTSFEAGEDSNVDDWRM